jgi:hypothetical protein
MSDVVINVVESATNVNVTEPTVEVDVTETVVEVSVSTAGIQGPPGANNDPTYVTVRNATGATLPKGTIVYISGANGNNVQVTPAIATSDATSARTLGWLSQSIANNASGLCMVEGYLEGLNTHGFTAGDQLYLSGTVAGGFTATKPQAPIHLVYVGVVTKVSAGDGHVFVKVQNGYELGELHDVKIDNPVNNQVLTYDSATDLWINKVNAADGVTSITATAPLTGGTITSTGSIGLDQTALSITKSQVSDFTSGTVTSASTAQQSGTAVYSVNSGTAVYSTTSGTALTITGDITKSQVSDFTSGTVTSASTAQQSGTAVYAVNSGTAVSISGSIAQSQVTDLVTDLAGKANLAGGNAFTEAQTITGSVIGDKVLVVKGASGQTANLFEVQDSTGTFRVRINQVGNSTFAGNITSQNNALFTPFSTATVPLTVQALASQSASVLALQNSAGSITANFTAPVNNVNRLNLGGTDLSATLGITVHASGGVGQVIRGAASQSANLLELRDSASTLLANFNSSGLLGVNGLRSPGGGSNRVDLNGGSEGATINAVSNNWVALGLRGLTSTQFGDLLQFRNSSGTILGGRNANAQIYSGSTAALTTSTGGATTGASGDGTTASISTSSNHNLSVGDRVTIAGITPTGYNGTYIVTAIVSAFTFSYANATTGSQTVAGTVRVDAQASVVTRSAASVPLLLRGATSQSANLFEIQNSSGSGLVSVTSAGNINAIGQARVGTTAGLAQLAVVSAGSSTIGAVIRGAASQTANLFEWQSSGASVLGSVDANGMANFLRGNFRGAVYGTGIYYGAVNVLQESGGHGITIQGRDSQTTDILRIRVGATPGAGNDALLVQNSAGAQLAKIESTGAIVGQALVLPFSAARLDTLSSGGVLTATRATAAVSNPGNNQARIYLRDGTVPGTLKLVVRAGAAGAETTILDNIPQ